MSTATQDLRERWGLSTGEIARALHTNANVIQHWGRGVEPNADEVARADLLAEFLEDLDLGDDAAAFMSAPIVDGYTANGWDLYTAGKSHLLLAYARSECSAEQTMTAYDPNWRSRHWTSFVTDVGEDGNLFTRGKTYEEVRGQV